MKAWTMPFHLVRRAWARQGLRLQFTALMCLVLVVSLAALAFVRSTVTQARALERARLVAAMAEAVGSWVSQHRGVWVFSDPNDSETAVGEALDHRLARAAGGEPADIPAVGGAPATLEIARTAGTFHRKAPSMVQRALSDGLAALGRGERFRVTSDRPLHPRNAPNPFEQAAIAHIRGVADQKTGEYHEVQAGQLLYARTLPAAAHCLRCHGRPDAGVSTTAARFSDTGQRKSSEDRFGGIVSVSVPLDEAPAEGWFGGVAWLTWAFLVIWMVFFGVAQYWLQRSVVRAAEVIEDYARRTLSAKTDLQASRIVIHSDEIASNNEMHKLSLSVKALHRALRMGGSDRPP
jgi:hypothetical protein